MHPSCMDGMGGHETKLKGPGLGQQHVRKMLCGSIVALFETPTAPVPKSSLPWCNCHLSFLATADIPSCMAEVIVGINAIWSVPDVTNM